MGRRNFTTVLPNGNRKDQKDDENNIDDTEIDPARPVNDVGVFVAVHPAVYEPDEIERNGNERDEQGQRKTGGKKSHIEKKRAGEKTGGKKVKNQAQPAAQALKIDAGKLVGRSAVQAGKKKPAGKAKLQRERDNYRENARNGTRYQKDHTSL
jgi:hypothetical protein